jgi:hypothetical protein
MERSPERAFVEHIARDSFYGKALQSRCRIVGKLHYSHRAAAIKEGTHEVGSQVPGRSGDDRKVFRHLHPKGTPVGERHEPAIG